MLNHKGTQIIETPRLILRPFTMDDAPAMFRNWASDPEVTKYLMWPTHPNVDVSQWVCNDWVSHYAEPDYYQWAIVYDCTSTARPLPPRRATTMSSPSRCLWRMC